MKQLPGFCIISAAAIMAVIFSNETAYGIAKFARLYTLTCESCHTKVPQLNEYGAAFMVNGFVLPGKEGLAKQGDKPTAQRLADGIAPRKGTAPSVGDEKAADQPAVETDQRGSGSSVDIADITAPPVIELPPTVVYKLPSRDGSIYYTDNPIRLDDLREPKSEIKSKVPISSNKLRPARAPQVESLLPARQTFVKTVAEAIKKPQLFRNYEECMEKQLVGVPQPGSAKGMMDLFDTAEKMCAPYQKGKR